MALTRLGLTEEALQVDQQIQRMRLRVRAYDPDTDPVLADKLTALAAQQQHKQHALSCQITQECDQLDALLTAERQHLLTHQEQQFLRLLAQGQRALTGGSCNCLAYACKHNKLVPTRRPSRQVTAFRQNARRLVTAGRAAEAAAWQARADAQDHIEAQTWQQQTAERIACTPWGVQAAELDQMVAAHRREVDMLDEAHAIKRDVLAKDHKMRMELLESMLAEAERRIRMHCRRQALLHMTATDPAEGTGEDHFAAQLGESLGADFMDMHHKSQSSNAKELAVSAQAQGMGLTVQITPLTSWKALPTHTSHPATSPMSSNATPGSNWMASSGHLGTRPNTTEMVAIAPSAPVPSTASVRTRLHMRPLDDASALDERPVSISPGSLKDADWHEHDMALAQTVGLANSYGVPTPIDEPLPLDEELDKEIEENMHISMIHSIGGSFAAAHGREGLTEHMLIVHTQATSEIGMRKPIVFSDLSATPTAQGAGKDGAAVDSGFNCLDFFAPVPAGAVSGGVVLL